MTPGVGYIIGDNPLSPLEIKKIKLYYSCRWADRNRKKKVGNYIKGGTSHRTI